MKRWRSWITTGLIVLAVVAVGYWGYSEHRVKQGLQNRAESQYQRAFHELSWHVDTISGQLAQLLISGARERDVLGLATVSRQVFAAQANLGSLPLALVPLSKTEKFLSDTGEVSFAFLNKTAQGDVALEEADEEIIEQLYQRSLVLKGDLSELAAAVLNKKLSWTEVEVVALRGNKDLEDNTIINGFQLMEKKMEEYQEINLGDDFSKTKPDRKKVEGEKEIDPQEAEEIARKWWFLEDVGQRGKLTYEGTGDIPTYGIEFLSSTNEANPIYIDVSKLDGSVVWCMRDKSTGEAKIALAEGEEKCREFLEKRGFQDTVLVETEREDSSAIYTFVPCQGDVLLYPEQLKIELALDDGEVVGYEGSFYYMYHQERELPEPVLSKEEVRAMVSPHLEVEVVRPALIVNYWGKEVLTWEVRGSYQEEKFAVFYNAETGKEEEVARLTPSPKFLFDLID